MPHLYTFLPLILEPSTYRYQNIQTNDKHEEGVHDEDIRISMPAHVDQGMSDTTKGGELTTTLDNKIGPKNTLSNIIPPELNTEPELTLHCVSHILT